MKFFRLTSAIASLTLVSLSLGVLPLAAADGPSPKGTAGPLPESTKYWVLFRHMTTLEAKAAELEKRGEDGSPYRAVFREGAKLTESQAARLSSIAADCVARVEEKDREAFAIIRAARELNGKNHGQIPPEPPAELERLQRERDALIDAAREDLRRAFGDKEFARLQKFVDETIAPTISRRQVAPFRPQQQ